MASLGEVKKSEDERKQGVLNSYKRMKYSVTGD